MRAEQVQALARAALEGDRARAEAVVKALAANERAAGHARSAERLEAVLGRGTHHHGDAGKVVRERGVAELVHETRPTRGLGAMRLEPETRRALEEVVEEQEARGALHAAGLAPRHRVLLIGPPGNGKTMAAGALAHALGVTLVTVRYERVVGRFLGETGARVGRIAEAVAGAPCVLFFDEFETLGKERDDGAETGEIKRVAATMLLALDALDDHVVVVAATNHAEMLDRAAWRRFEVRLTLPAPTPEEAHAAIESVVREAGGGTTTEQAIGGLARATSWAEIEALGDDVRRRRVVEGDRRPGAEIARERLAQWRARMRTREEAQHGGRRGGRGECRCR